MDLDFMQSPIPDRPGLLVRDPHQYSDATLVIPPPLVECLRFFNGSAVPGDLHSHLTKISGGADVAEIEQHLMDTLRDCGFLDDDVYRRLREEKHRAFAEAPVREPSHSGGAYPGEPEPLRQAFSRYLEEAPAPEIEDGLIGIAAPHVSPEGGRRMYGAAYKALAGELRDRVFVILGTSHYGDAGRFGLTRKPFRTPYGDAPTEVELVDRLASAAPAAVTMEDYCHSTEHSIEFQVVFLQHLFGPDVRILPILCGSYGQSVYSGGMPEDDENVRSFLSALRDLAAVEGDRLFWILGVDLAHMGRRYGDDFPAVANQGKMAEVAARDEKRASLINGPDAEGFWGLIRENEDDLMWCGSAPFYTMMRAVPNVRSRLLGYDQWNIDEQSVVTFGAMAFYDGSTRP